MSRVDEAFRVREGAVSDESAGPDGGLNTYSKESSVRPATAGRAERPEPTRLKTEAARAVTGSVTLTPRKSRKPEQQARLVTGGAEPMCVEQYRRLSAVLHDAQMQRGLKSVMVTSAVPNEGKTLTTVNLGLTLSESYARRVLVIDADLRWPTVHEVLGIANGRGLSEALTAGQTDLPYVQVTERLAVLTAGSPGPTPLAGLSSERMATILDECTAAFDWVLVDTPPVGLMPDAQLLARLTGGVLLVIAAGATPAAAVEKVVTDLGPECILGTVLNRVESHRIAQSGYYYRYGGRSGQDGNSSTNP